MDAATLLTRFGRNRLTQTWTALIREHIDRGGRHLEAARLLRDPPHRPSPWVLHEVGALCVLRNLDNGGVLAAVAPELRRTPPFYPLAIHVLSRFLYRPLPHMQVAGFGLFGLQVTVLRLREEAWWFGDAGPEHGLTQIMAKVTVCDAALDALAQVLWAARRNVTQKDRQRQRGDASQCSAA